MRSPAFFPLAVSGLLIALALLLVLRGLRQLAKATPGAAPGSAHADPDRVPTRAVVVGALLIAATGGVFVLGYVVTAMLLIAALGLALGYRRLIVLLPLAVGVPLTIQALFQGVLRVLLPTGVL